MPDDHEEETTIPTIKQIFAIPTLVVRPESESVKNHPEEKDIILDCRMTTDFRDCVLCVVIMEWRNPQNKLLKHARYDHHSEIPPEVVDTLHDPTIYDSGNYTCVAKLTVGSHFAMDLNSTVHINVVRDSNTLLWIATLIVVLILGISLIYCTMGLLRGPKEFCSKQKRKDSYNVEEAARKIYSLGMHKFEDAVIFGGPGYRDMRPNERVIL